MISVIHLICTSLPPAVALSPRGTLNLVAVERLPSARPAVHFCHKAI
jgi:hypothetical protein